MGFVFAFDAISCFTFKREKHFKDDFFCRGTFPNEQVRSVFTPAIKPSQKTHKVNNL